MATIAVGAISACFAVPRAQAAEGPEFEHFVTVCEGRFFDGERRLRFVSWNIPNLIAIEDALDFLGESPWRWPDEFEIADALESVRQLGGGVARTYVITVRRQGSDMGEHVHVLAPGRFNEEAFVALDRALAIAAEKRVRIILPLVDNWHWMGGIDEYAAFRGKQKKAFWTDRQIIDDFKATIRHVVTRRNTVNGIMYRNDKTIFGWETGNELDAPPEWTAEIAAYLKELDPNHLVIDGRSLHGVPVGSLDDPNLDAVTTHHYPGPGVDMVEQIRAGAGLARGKKAYFVGEIGFIPVGEARRVLATVIEEDVAGALYWSLRFHRREGGFYWHDEPLGANLFKAYHWPGFASGDLYEERPLLETLADAARRISDADLPALTAPAAARLLPIEHPGRISWQGSAGASGYDVQRATAAGGPWLTIGGHVSDAAVQYRPLFCDATVRPGRAYYYRVIARGAGGESAPSNIVGPVRVDHRLLVDELADESLRAGTTGPATFRSDRARRAQEDMHRVELGPDGTIEYRLPNPVESVAAWLFAESADHGCVIEGSTDGVEFAPLAAASESRRRGAGDYAYLQPMLLRAKAVDPAVRVVRIRNAAGQVPVQVSRVEIAYDLLAQRRP
ncbi:MAG: hypothetical protein KF847_04235 [Pirellulales bacterium]|nr:hypothetical protein [Pirellulales bacterium]